MKSEDPGDFVSEAAVRQLLVGPMAVVASGMSEDMVDFAGRPELGEGMLFLVPRETRVDAKLMARGPHPAFVPGERRAAAPVPRGRTNRKVRSTSMKGLAVVIGSGLAASMVMAAAWFHAFPAGEHGALTVPAAHVERTPASGAETERPLGDEAAAPLLVRRQWDIGAP